MGGILVFLVLLATSLEVNSRSRDRIFFSTNLAYLLRFFKRYIKKILCIVGIGILTVT